VKPQPAPEKRARLTGLFKLLASYAVALVLPALGAVVSLHTHAFQSTPLGLSFACIAIVSLVGGFGPGLVASISTAVSYAYEIAPDNVPFTHGRSEIIHTAVIVLLGIVVTYLCERQRDISDRLRIALANLQVKTDGLVEAQQASSSVAWTYDTQARLIQWAEGGPPIFGLPFETLASYGLPMNLVLEEDRPAVTQILDESFASQTPFQIQFRSRMPGGELRWFESRGRPSPRQKNLWRGVTLDITERKSAEIALVRSEKLAAIGRLSATIAHEMNNPLEAVTNLLFLCSSDTTLSPETRAYLSSADQELRRLASIARHTLSFARPHSSGGPAHTAGLIEAVVEMFQPRCASRGGAIQLVCNPDLILAAPPDEVRQMLTNLVSNACDAIDGPSSLIAIDVSADDEYATIEVRDNGVGIAPENLDHIFDPFFTTKPDVGTGIGLWVTRELAAKRGGDIEVKTEGLPHGFRTAFRIQLPLQISPVEPFQP
jgi:PAS domain S-box-containing protein